MSATQCLPGRAIGLFKGPETDKAAVEGRGFVLLSVSPEETQDLPSVFSLPPRVRCHQLYVGSDQLLSGPPGGEE